MQCFWMMLIDMCVIFSTQLHRKAWRSNDFFHLIYGTPGLLLKKHQMWQKVTKYDNMWQNMKKMWHNMTQCDKIWHKMWHNVTAHLEKSSAFWILFSQPANSCLKEPQIPNKHVTNTKYKRIKVQNKQLNKYFLPICQMLFTGSRLNPKAVEQNIFLLLKNTVNWKGFQHCELKRRTSMFTFSTQASPSKRHQSISGYLHTSWCTLVQ